MEMKDQDLYVLQLVQYFIEQQHYQMVVVQNHKNDVWLANSKHAFYPIIRVSAESEEELYYEHNYIKEMHETICNQLNIKKPLLMIQTLQTPKSIKQSTGEFITILPNTAVPKKIASIFQGIEQVVHPVSDISQEVDKIGKSIHHVQLERQKKALHNLRKPPKSFWFILLLSSLLFIVSSYFTIQTNDIYQGLFLGGAYYKMSILVGLEYWRFLTAPFTHFSLFQLLIDFYILYLLAKSIDNFYPKKLLPIFMITSFCAYVVEFIGIDNEIAFGMIPGLLGLWGAYTFAIISKKMLRIIPIKIAYMRMFIMMLVLIIVPGISYLAVAVGFISGVLCGMMWSDEPFYKQMKKHVLIASLLLLGCLSWFQITQNQLIYNVDKKLDQKLIQSYRHIGLKPYADWLEERFIKYY